MAEAELRDMLRADPMFGRARAVDTSSRQRSRDSAAASTRSWVIMNANSPPPPPPPGPLPLPEPVPSLAPSRPLPMPPRRTASALTEANVEHMQVEVPSPEMGYQWTTGKVYKAKEAHANRTGFVGGFVSGLKKLPKALGRRRPRRGTEATEFTSGTEGTGNTLPQYRSVPPTPVVPDRGVSFAAPLARKSAPTEQYRPSFILVPPEDDEEHQLEVDSGVVLAAHDAAMPGGFDSAEGPSTRVRPPTPAPAIARTRSHTSAPSPRPSRVDDRLAPAEREGDEPVSVNAHPQPTEDYRRMSAHDVAISRQHSQRSRTTVDESFSHSMSSPSFAQELHGPIYRFFNALHLLPWVATDRITADWKPPKRKPRLENEGVSWYYPMGHAPPSTRDSSLFDSTHTALHNSERGRRSGETREIGRDVHIRRHRSHRPRSTPVDRIQTHYTYAYAPYPAFSPPPPAPPLSRHSPQRSPPPQTNGPGTLTSQPAIRRRHRRRPSTSATTPPYHHHRPRQHREEPVGSTYVAHWGHMPVPLPVQMQMSPQILPSAAPLYIIQATPIGSPALSDASAGGIPGVSDAGGTAGSDGANGGQHNNSGASPTPAPQMVQMLAPVYMQMPMNTSPNTRPASPRQQHYTAYGYGYGYGSPVMQMQMATPVSMPGT
ncbi:hypothetical protein MIND_00975000 [Mycena indigotica]|uniref:Uncharacterized protein n=1 Tax=Mycena indigotica TaxID=2126181 RepID=A0A8H6W2Y0_9AGAR|nr:uncharacterized protein MIND_00975000 [Mycena indigotica]KAF7297414.1 hypothetical protein MIND_00975000 [Mycena indigotica]